jgi:hypothetical protein
VTVVSLDPGVPWSRFQRLASTLLATLPGGDPAPRGGDLFSLADSVAAAVGGAVAIMDTGQTIVAYSNLPDQPIDEMRRLGILRRRVPEDAIPEHLSEVVWRSDTVVRHCRPGDMPRVAMVIRAGDDVLGSLWALVPEEVPVAECEPVMRQAARVAALHMLTLRQQLDADQESRNRAFRAALDGDPGSGGTVLRLPAVMLGAAAAAAAGPGQGTRSADLMRLLDLFGLDGRALGHQPALALSDDRVHALLPARAGGSVPVAALLAHLRDRAARSLHLEVTMVSTGPVRDLAELQRARRDIDTAIDHLRASGRGPGQFSTEELRTELVGRRLLAAVRADPLLRTGLGERIADHDREHGTAFGASLLRYLRRFGDVAAAGEELHIHQNTLRQRLRRARELFGLDLDDPGRRLTLWLELAAFESAEAAEVAEVAGPPYSGS